MKCLEKSKGETKPKNNGNRRPRERLEKRMRLCRSLHAIVGQIEHERGSFENRIYSIYIQKLQTNSGLGMGEPHVAK